jgi:hypothetical protein
MGNSLPRSSVVIFCNGNKRNLKFKYKGLKEEYFPTYIAYSDVIFLQPVGYGVDGKKNVPADYLFGKLIYDPSTFEILILSIINLEPIFYAYLDSENGTGKISHYWRSYNNNNCIPKNIPIQQLCDNIRQDIKMKICNILVIQSKIPWCLINIVKLYI